MLPVKGVPDDLMYWHFALQHCRKTARWMHDCNVEWVQRQWRSAIEDQSLLYVLLFQAERNHMVISQTSEARYLYYKDKALQALRKQIQGLFLALLFLFSLSLLSQHRVVRIWSGISGK